MTNAICAVLQDTPATLLPHEGNARTIYVNLMPILAELFDMPAVGPEKDTPAWIRQMVRTVNTAEYSDIAQHDVILEAYIQHMQRTGDHNGGVRLEPGEAIPTTSYKMVNIGSRSQVLSPKALSGHAKLRSVQYYLPSHTALSSHHETIHMIVSWHDIIISLCDGILLGFFEVPATSTQSPNF